ncbi:erythromycin esterase-like protein [Spirosoma oryzae]|uniref:Erythromycin esterase-like protein n=1 Tax=Spirosoma oryzae TaxID=1469603 RepID=A0A2T0TNV7_9BACT|nr:erythromycin esterase family protein [Spirosoma oryzae]PRY47218.1 erythromycin esterase-like protein [Spirosoma oryzae]
MNRTYQRFGCLLLTAWLLSCPALRGQINPVDLGVLRASLTPFQPQALTDTTLLGLTTPLTVGKTIVAVGEVTHGTHQTADVQAKLARDLCRTQRFNTIVLAEVYASATLALNRYVLLDEGTLQGALTPLADAQPIAPQLIELIRWVHQQNRHRPFAERIWLVGTEIDSPGQLAQLLRLTPGIPADADSALATLSYLPVHLLKKAYSSAAQASAQAMFNQCLRRLPTTQPDSLGLLARWQQHLLSQHQLAWAIHRHDEEAPRDSAMFASIQWLLAQRPHTKIVIINAHNAHIEKQPCYQLGFRGVKRLGHYLHQAYGSAYCALGTEIDGGRFLSRYDRRGDSLVSVAMPGSRKGMGRLLSSLLPASYGLLDLRGQAMGDFFRAYQPRLSYGTSSQGVGYLAPSQHIPLAFDGLIFLGPSHPAHFIHITPPELFGVYLTLPPARIDSLVRRQRLLIDCGQISWVGQPARQSDLHLQVYQHDGRKRLLSFAAQGLAGHVNRSLLVGLHPRTRYLSISVVSRNGQQCQIGQIRLNGQPVDSQLFQLIPAPPFSVAPLAMDYQPQGSGFALHYEPATTQP